MLAPQSAPGALPLIGHTLAYMRDPLGFLERAAQRCRVARIRVATLSAYLVSEPEDIERVLVTDQKKFIKDAMTRRLGRVLGEGLLTSEGETWRKHRKLIAPAFHNDRSAHYAAAMVSAAERAADEMRPGETRDIHADMMRLTLSIIARVMFDSDVASVADDLVRAVNTIVELFGDGPLEFFEFVPWLDKLPLPANARLKEAIRTIDEIILRAIRERRSHADLGTDLLGMLLSARDESGAALSDREVGDEIKTIFLAGHETAALVLSFAFVLLSQSPEASRKLATELDEVLPGQRTPTAEDVPRLRFTHAVVLESLRIYPPVWMIGREALVDIEISGYPIPKGGQVWISPWVSHRDPRYFSAPSSFSPDRWLDGLEKRLPRGVFMPFGGGPRICIATTFATMEAVLVLATLARRLSIQVQSETPQKLDPLVTLRPKGPILARIEAR